MLGTEVYSVVTNLPLFWCACSIVDCVEVHLAGVDWVAECWVHWNEAGACVRVDDIA
jgi:hypothetical protein